MRLFSCGLYFVGKRFDYINLIWDCRFLYQNKRGNAENLYKLVGTVLPFNLCAVSSIGLFVVGKSD